jgi:hypothetical protein
MSTLSGCHPAWWRHSILIMTIPRVLFATLQRSATNFLTICRTNEDFNLFGVHSCLENISLYIKRDYEQTSTSERSCRRIEKCESQSIPGERHWRTREDPLDTI